MKVIRANSKNFSLFWKKLWNSGNYHYPLYGEYNLNFYKVYSGDEEFSDNSFVVEDNGESIAGMRVTSSIKSSRKLKFSAFNLPSLYFDNADANSSSRSWKLIKKEIEALISKSEHWSWQHREFLSNGAITPVGRFFLSIGGKSKTQWIQLIDLNKSEDDLLRGISKGCRSCVNWGKDNLNIQILDAGNISKEYIDEFRELHIKVAGRETRNEETWAAQLNMVINDEAFLSFGYIENQLVSAALFSYSDDYCFYGVSASDRELFNKPISHAVIWEGILYSRSIGCKWFDLGTQCFPKELPIPTKKELSISSFKHSFGGKTIPQLIIETNSDNSL